MKFIKKTKKGFTLVELVVVIAIIAILSGVSVAVYVSITNKAKQTADSEIISQLNLQMKAQEVYGRNNTCYEAYLDAREIGFDLALMKPSYGDQYVWDQENDRFAVTKNGEVVAQDNDQHLTSVMSKRWIFVSSINANEKKSQYLTDNDYTGAVTVISGFDAGDNDGVTAVNYANAANVQDIIIRTTSANTQLTVDDKTASSISHYGSLGKLFVTECGFDCYYEYGTTAYAKAEKGKVVAKTDGEITVLYATVAAVSAKEDGGIIGDAYCVSTTPKEESADGYTNFSNSKGGNVPFKYTDDGTSTGTCLTDEQIETVGQVVVTEAVEEERLEDFKENNYWIGSAAYSFAGGDGTATNPYLISTAEELARLSYLMSTAKYSYVFDKNFKLTANIDLSEKCWIPIGVNARGINTQQYFCGTFDGNGKTITGLNDVGLSMSYLGTMINETTPLDGTEYLYGLFGGVNTCTIKNLSLENVNIKNGDGNKIEEDGRRFLADSVGSVVGYVNEKNTLTLNNVKVLSGSVYGFEAVGGLVGRVYGSAKLTDCSNAAYVSAVRRAAGLIGYANKYFGGSHDTTGTADYPYITGNDTLYFKNCSNTGNITCFGASMDYTTSTFTIRHIAAAYFNGQPDGTTIMVNPNATMSNTGAITTYFANGIDAYTEVVYAGGPNSAFK